MHLEVLEMELARLGPVTELVRFATFGNYFCRYEMQRLLTYDGCIRVNT